MRDNREYGGITTEDVFDVLLVIGLVLLIVDAPAGGIVAAIGGVGVASNMFMGGGT